MSESGFQSRNKRNYEEYKSKQKKKYKYLSKGPSKMDREISTEKVLPTYHSNREDIYQINPKTVRDYPIKDFMASTKDCEVEKTKEFCISIFESNLYRDMVRTTRKLFRKQCFRLHKKRVLSSTEPWTIQIKCKPKGRKMEVRVELMSDYANKIESKLIQPKHP